MKKSRAFSLMEVIVSVFILFLVLIPSKKLNSQQLKTYSKIRAKEKELHFFNSLNNYIKSKGVNGFISAYECFIESIRPNIPEIDLKHLDLSFKLASDSEYSTNLQLKIREKGELNV